MILVYLLLAVLLLCLNAFFVLAEFAAVRLRGSRTRELVKEGEQKATVVEHIQEHLDEYLSVCQLGITFASIGLGFVGEPIVSEFLSRSAGLSSPAATTIALAIGYILVSFLHVVVGELLPKSVALRQPEPAALWTARPLRVFRMLFYLPLVVLNGATQALLRLLGQSRHATEPAPSENELRQILGDSAERGVMSFDRLLLLENIFDLSELRVRDIMRPRNSAKTIRSWVPWEENLAVIRGSRFSRYPLLEEDGELPRGIVHVKDLFYLDLHSPTADDLRKIARPYFITTEETMVEQLLRDLRKHRTHLVMVRNPEGRWSGFLSLEDVIEEIVGSIEDEFEIEPAISLTDALSPGRVVLGVEASGLEEAIGQTFGRIPPSELPLPTGKVVQSVLERERAMATYVGQGIALPHARIESLAKPLLIIARSEQGIPVRNSPEKARFLFILLTPAGAPRLQARLLARIAELFQSEFIEERLTKAETPSAIVEAIRTAEPIATTAP
ncbi:MAG TPA: CNNM domain-containing protein [Planctomycetota bacterium]|nr:CNNM domain-containing protein [Planctomycetota bacterium]